jgi:serine/threonine-protein kinase
VDEGSTVDLVVSTGLVPVPGVIGDTEAQARATLVNAGFEVQVLTQEDAEATAGTVIAQSPEEGTPTRLGSVVTLTVATAPPTPSPTPTEDASATPSPSGTSTP